MDKQRLSGGLFRPLLIVLLLLLVAPIISAQQRTGRALQFGLQATGILGTPSSEFTALPGVANCAGSLNAATTFTGGSGGGFAGAILVGMTPVPAMNSGFLSHLGFDVAAGYSSSATTFEVEERIGQSIDPAGNISSVFSRYSIDTKVSELRFEPSARYFIGPDLPLAFSLGAKIGLMLGGTYDQKETIASPSKATFEDGSKERNATSGDLAETSAIQAGLTLGLGYDVTLSPTLTLRPQAAWTLGLTSPVSGITWSPHELRFGLALLLTPAPEQSTPLQPVKEGE